jgi:predicted amidophosphoribosyltransferase
MSYYTEAMARYIQILKSQPFDFVPGVLKKGVQLLVEHWSEEINHWDFNVLATVPSNFLRAFVETNLTSLFAIELSEKIKKPYLPKLLSSSNCFFPQQKNVSKKDRWQARKKQFVCSNKARGIKNKVLLIDDICTTGSSLFHAAEALKDKGWYCERALVLSSARKLDF